MVLVDRGRVDRDQSEIYELSRWEAREQRASCLRSEWESLIVEVDQLRFLFSDEVGVARRPRAFRKRYERDAKSDAGKGNETAKGGPFGNMQWPRSFTCEFNHEERLSMLLSTLIVLYSQCNDQFVKHNRRL